MNAFLNRAIAVEQLTAPAFLSTTTPNRYWNSDVWDGHRYNLVDGLFYAGASCQLILRQGPASGYWDYQSARDVASGVTYAFSEILKGQYLQARVVTVSGATPATFRLQAMGKVAGPSVQDVQDEPYSVLVGNEVLLCTTNSGGTILNSNQTESVVVRALSVNNGDIYLGGASGTPYMAYSGFGVTILTPADAVTIPIVNPNLITACATASGDRLIYGGAR